MAAVFLMEAVVGIAGYILEDQIEDMLVKTMNQTLQDYESDPVTAYTVDALQYEVLNYPATKHCLVLLFNVEFDLLFSYLR